MPTDDRLAATIALAEAQRRVDRATEFLGYRRGRRVREISDFLAARGFPKDPDQRLSLSLIPLLEHDAREEGVDWTVQAGPRGSLAALFDLDLRVMTGGRQREELTAEEYGEYVAESKRHIDEHIASMRRTFGPDT